ncbi:hypothetical protein D0Z00_003174 [Geotrichum galactomycetum]|uniref:Uncharacterized protein n=1 Tax=Geotrichum galactomycetum TaxID=27317 RepID=A0ACB6V247_9ASCO|nr:hypothetical protein D0Z00_003174 [Geotrichum candidum]
MIRSVSIRALRQATPLLRVVPAAVNASRGIHATPATRSHYNDPAGSATPAPAPKTLADIHKLYRNNTPITVLTAHDYISGKIASAAAVDMILVGDSLSMVALGYTNTNEIELDDMIHHARAVRRGSPQGFIVADLPFGSYEVSTEQALAAAFRMVKRAGVDAIKFEGGKENATLVRQLTQRGIPVMGHIGLTPQRASALSGFKVQGKTAATAALILEDALALQQAGCFSMVLEAVPAPVAEIITKQLRVPIIGIGAGPHTSGQVLVQLDMLGGFDGFTPRFLKKYSNYLDINTKACATYVNEVRARTFPEIGTHTYPIKDAELVKFKQLVAEKYQTPDDH